MFINYPGRKSDVPLRRLLPNLLTTVALCSGLAAIHFAIKADWDRALSAVAVAAVFDALDRRAARLLKATSNFGAVLDSLSDFLSFGVAPAIILHQWMLKDETGPDAIFGLAAVMTFVLCSALRLARFTAGGKGVKPAITAGVASVEPKPAASAAMPPPSASKFFVGLPTPAAAGAVLVPPMLYVSHTFSRLTENPGGYRTATWLVILYTFLVAGLMISRLPMFSFKKLRIDRRLVVPMLVVVGLVVVAVSRDAFLTAAGICGVYLLLLPVSIAAHRRMQRVEQSAAGSGATNSSAPTDSAATAHLGPRGL